MVKKKKVEQEHDFYYAEGEIHLYDADAFISQIKHMMTEASPDSEFGIYIGVSENECLEIWVRDENDVMYQIQAKNLEDDESEISLNEVIDDED